MSESAKMIYAFKIPRRVADIIRAGVSELEKKKGEEGRIPFQLESVSTEEAELKAIAGTVLPGIGLIDALADQMGAEPFEYVPLAD